MKTYVAQRTRILKVFLMAVSLFGLFWLFNSSNASVSNEYVANYEIKADRDTILWLLVEIDAGSKIWDQIPQTKFAQLNASFQTVFPKLPQQYTYKVVYQQCLSLSQGLTTYTNADYQNKLSTFLTSCYKPLSDIFKQISTKYSVVANAKVSPQGWPAPLVVTLDARASTDPSNDTIPSKNYFWYYRDIDGQDKAIGVGPVVTATFTNAGNYLVHLTVRSSNKVTEGIFDGDKTMSIDVTPKTANITVYANSQKINKDGKTKISIQEAEKWVVFDGSATVPMWGRQILSHVRSLTSQAWFVFTQNGDGKPGIIRVVIPWQGEYKLTLTTKDNEWNSVSETYYLVVSDPVAIIKQMPNKWTTSTTFGFDATASYSIVSTLKLYTWDLYDENGNKLETYQGQSIKQQFKKPGAYTVKLTVQDNLGQTNVDTVQVFVESSDPIPQFTMTSSNTWKDPSEFIFDASVSSDVDKTNGYDHLTYEWFLGDASKAKLVSSENNNEKVKVQFDAIGVHTIKLVAKDDFGKLTEISKDIEVKSILRPEIFAVPVATQRGNPVNFVVKSNEPIVNYIRDFWDGDTRTIQADKISHTYKKSGVYKVILKVSGADGMSNEVTKTIFIWEKQNPVWGYVVLDKTSNILTQNETCTQNVGGNELSYPAFQLDRYQDITIDPSISVNTKWQKTDIQFYYQPQNGEIFKSKTFAYKFNELWCTYVDLTVEDTAISKDDKIRIRFKIVNALPVLDNIILAFPQYGNEVGVGFNENNVKDIFSDTFDPLIVKVSALNATDLDGFISYFKWYYTYKDDPTRYLETKITPWNIPYAFFSLPRVPGEFLFGVVMYDNDGGKQGNEDIVGNWPIVFFPPDVTRPDIPLVTLKSSQSTVEIWDEVQFDVVSKIISDRPDFVQERTIQYDFDGDGTWDMTTKSDRVKYVYTKPNEFGYKPRAAVLYRWYKGVGNWGTIVVRNWLKPMLLSDSFDKLAIFRDVSIGDITNKTVCLNLTDCSPTGGHLVTSGVMFSTTYPDYGKYYISLDVTDKNANIATKKRALTLTTGVKNSDIHILSIPQSSITTTQGTEFFVGKNLNNSILFYVLYDFSRGTCYVDADLSIDSNGDGNVEGDNDFSCNSLYLQTYEPKYQSTKGRIYYTNTNNQLISSDFTVSFLDFESQMDTGTMAIYKELDILIAGLPAAGTGANANFKLLVTQLRDNLIDKNVTRSNLVAVRDYWETNTITLDTTQRTTLESVFARLSDKSTVAAEWGGVYLQAKADILSILPTNLSVDVSALFNDFESIVSDANNSQQDQRKATLQSILTLIQKNANVAGQPVKENQIDTIDIEGVVIPSLCKIMSFYNIASTTCPNADIKIVDTPVAASNAWGTTRRKILLWIVGIAAGIFVILIWVFAVRAKIKQANAEEEEIISAPTVTPPAV